MHSAIAKKASETKLSMPGIVRNESCIQKHRFNTPLFDFDHFRLLLLIAGIRLMPDLLNCGSCNHFGNETLTNY